MSETAVAIVATSLWVGGRLDESPQAASVRQAHPARTPAMEAARRSRHDRLAARGRGV
jgi:hypothetical protein